ncbi:MAG: T9SS type A sorting domain-containing protein [Chitinophagaceae bacterium]|nr:T9SS type A sorting domain-containing protein [Chitinophagaceae bacterium]
MRTCFLLVGLLIILSGQVMAQRACNTSEYQQQELINDPAFAARLDAIEAFIQKQKSKAQSANTSARLQQGVIKIPVVVHILYHQPGENISDQRVNSQIEMLNKCFRRQNADTANTPASFKALSADCEIEFQLAISDPQRRNTSGVIHKYTPVVEWQMDDKMKFASEMGDDAWNPSGYLNIWVCNLKRIAGYASLPGSEASKDGIVIDYSVFGTNGSSGYEMGKTAVHEVAHWLGIKHIWGDAYCGDDLVEDTPKQGNYTTGCPTGARVSCTNGPAGDMYMNYMDYTNDACINLFTEGQKTRMRTLFTTGGQRSSLLSSSGLSAPLIFESPLPDESPRWLHPQIYPNPVTSELTIDVAYDVRWVGKTVSISDISGHIVMQVTITSKIQTVNISRLQTGMYFLSVRKEDGSYIKQKFIKM